MLKCPLCQKDVVTFHRRSHLLPEWMYADFYDNNHKLINVSITKKHVNKKQKGYYSNIICKNCEQSSQKYDRYGSVVLTNRSPIAKQHSMVSIKKHSRIAGNDKINYSHYTNLDFLKFQKFVFACVLRSHFAEVKAGRFLLVEKHFERIRALYLSDVNQDDYSYPIIVSKLTDKDSMKNIMFMPFVNRIDSHRVIEFMGGGYFFRVYVSSHKKDPCVYTTRLQKDGSIYMIHFDIREIGTFKGAFPTLVELAHRFPLT